MITLQKHRIGFSRTAAALSVIFFTTLLYAKTCYVDPSGNDNATGLTTTTAWKTVNKVNNATLNAGDSILFKRGGLWRGEVLIPKGGTSAQRILYGAYGTGNKPALWGSTNKSTAADWISEGANIWRCASAFYNVGNIVFENNAVGIKKWNASDLAANDDYWCDETNHVLKIYSQGNPATRHTNIEICDGCTNGQGLINISCSNVTIQDFEVKYGGCHAVSGGGCSNVTVRNCEISWIGGSHLIGYGTSPTRFGNGIQFWDQGSNIVVEQNKIWEIWDTGITNQGSDAVQDNIIYRNNLVYNVGMGFYEGYLASGTISNILIENNTFAFDQAGWSRTQRSTTMGGMIYWSAAGVTYTNDIIRNNIFYNVPYSVYLYATGKIGPNMITMDYNCYWSTGSLSGSYIWREFSGTPSYNLSQLSQFQSATGQDVHSFVADPKFANAANGDFHITAGSPCINKGTIATSATDLDGNQRSSPYDIGAYEYGAIVPVLPRESIPGAVNTNAYFTGAKSIFRIAGDRFIMPQGFAGQTGACAVYDLSGNLLKTIYVGNGIIDFSKGQRMSDGVYVVQMKERSYHASKSKEL